MAKPQGTEVAFRVLDSAPPLQVRQHTSSCVIGCGLWNAGVAMVFWLAKNAHLVHGKRVLELGSGCGQGGLAAALLGASAVVVSDRGEAVANLAANVARNAVLAPIVTVAEIDWCAAIPQELKESGATSTRAFERTLADGSFVPDWAPAVLHGTWDVILCADCCYGERFVVPLVCALLALANHCGAETIIMAHDDRNTTATALLVEEMERYWTVKRVPQAKLAKSLPTDGDALIADGVPVALTCEDSLQFYVLRR